MKLLEKKQHTVKVKLTSIDGETKEFDSIQEAADFLEVTRMAIYQAIGRNGKCRGCKIERIWEMKFKYTNKETFKTVGKIKEIMLKYTKNGSELVVLVMQDGRNFTNFKNIWDKIGIDIDSINEGDELEIEYAIYIHNNCTKYLNFWNVVNKLKIDDSRLTEPPFWERNQPMNDIQANLLYSQMSLRDYPTDEELEDMAKIFDDYTLVNINAPFWYNWSR